MDALLWGQGSYLYLFAALMMIGYFAGRASERRHYRSILRREEELSNVLAFSAKSPPVDVEFEDATLVVGNVVVSVDYFKKFVAGLRNLVGGRMLAYETLLDRARREALLRMKNNARTAGADMIFNVKLESVELGNRAGGGVRGIEMYAYGTALRRKR